MFTCRQPYYICNLSFLHNLFTIRIDGKRVFGLDILRAVAIMSVLWGHAIEFLGTSYSSIERYNLDGVGIFFVFSGFLIGGILIKILSTKPPTFRILWSFWVRRWLRTLPNYFLILAMLTAIAVVFGNGAPHILQYFTFTQNFSSQVKTENFFPESWSLSVEEWFYLITPIMIFATMILLGKKHKRTAFIIISILVIASVTGYRCYCFSIYPPQNIEEWDNMYRRPVITRLDALMFGVIGAYISFYHNRTWIRYKRQLLYVGLILLVIPVIIAFPFNTLYACAFYFTTMSVGTLFLLPFLSQYIKGEGKVYRAITHISLISYSMYLLNYSLIRSFIIKDICALHIFPHISSNEFVLNAVGFILFWVITFLSSTLLYKFFEVPVMNYRDKLHGYSQIPGVSLIKRLVRPTSSKSDI